MLKLEKTIKYGIYLAMLLPLVFTSRTMFPWHFGKTVLFQILVEILICLALVYFSLNKEKKIIKLNLLDWLVFAFVICQLVSSIFGVNFTRSFWGGQSRAQGVFTLLHFAVFYFLLRQFFQNKKDWQNLIIWILLIGFISSLIAWAGPYLSFLEGIVAPGRFSGLIGNPIFFAGYLIIPVFLGFAWFFVLEKDNKWRWFGLAAGAFSLITLLSAQVRGAFVGLIIGIFVVWIFYLFYGQSARLKKICFVIGMLSIVLISVVYIFNQKSGFFKNNLPAIARLLDIRPSETTAITRLMAWQIALKGWKDKPLFGWGPENYQDIFDKYYNPKFLEHSFAETVWDKPHSYPLEVLSSMGIIGFSCYASIIVILLFYLTRIIKKQDNDNKKFAFMILTGAIAAYIVQNSFGIETSNSLQMWFSAVAFIGFFYGITEKRAVFCDKELAYKLVSWLALLALLITPCLIYKNYNFFKASVVMGDAEDAAKIESLYLWQKNAPKVLDVKTPFIWEQAIFLTKNLSIFDGKQILDKKTLETVAPRLADIFEENIKKYSTSYVLRFWAGQLYCFMGEYIDNKYYAQSEQLLNEALNMNRDRQPAAMVLAKSYLLQNKTKEGIALLEEINKGENDYAEAHWFLGLALIQDKQKEKGIEELEKGINFGSGLENNILYLIDLYAEKKQYEKIIPLYERLITQKPDNPQYYASLAVAYAGIGDEENTVKNLSKAVELQPELAEEAKKFLEQRGIDIEK